jgi:hypothetical protein
LEKAEKGLARAKGWHEKTRTVNIHIFIIILENVLHSNMPLSCIVCIAIWSF